MMAKDRTEYLKAYRVANKERRNEYNKKWLEANPESHAKIKEKAKIRSRIYYAANSEKQKKNMCAWYQSNKEHSREMSDAWIEENKERYDEWRKQHYKDNKPYYFANASRRRARRRNAIPPTLRNCPIENKRLIDIVKLRNTITIVTGIEHHVDHMWPLDADGPHWSGNLQIITAEENLRKGAKVDPQIKEVIKHSLEIFLKDYKNGR